MLAFLKGNGQIVNPSEHAVRDDCPRTIVDNLAHALTQCIRSDIPESEHEALLAQTMAELLQARVHLGQFCQSIGSPDRMAVVLSAARTFDRVGSLHFAADPSIDYGPLRTTYSERLFINAAGVFIVAAVMEQGLNYDPRERENEVSYDQAHIFRQLTELQRRSATAVKFAGLASDGFLADMFEKLDIGDSLPVLSSRADALGCFDWDWVRDQLGRELEHNVLSPGWMKCRFGPLRVVTDFEFETEPATGFATVPALRTYRVTWPEPALQALSASITRTYTKPGQGEPIVDRSIAA